MTKYIITVTDDTLDDAHQTVFDVPCESLPDLEAELRAWTNYVAYGVILEVFRFDEESLDYDLVDRIEA